MEPTLACRAYAKVNLSLAVLGRRADSRHELFGVMQRISLYDEVFVSPAKEISVSANVLLPEENTAMLAARAYKSACGCGGAHIQIVKHLPAQAGLGAGSADAAAVLMLFSRLYGGVSKERLFSLALSVGADVPFCLLGGTALAEGIGERLTPIPSFPHGLPLVIAKGEHGVSTAELFSSLGLPVPKEGLTKAEGLLTPDTERLMRALKSGDLRETAQSVSNALEAPACALCPEIARVKERLLASGAVGASMTGSGSAVFGIYETITEAKRAEKMLSDLPFAKACRCL